MKQLPTPRAVSLSSLTNDRMRELDLYVMQNEHGAIKLGRSVDPEARRKQLQTETRCKILLVATFDKSGHFEEWLHLQLQIFRIDQEWFTGSTDSRQAIVRLLRSPLAWPFDHNIAGEEQWLKTLREARAGRYWQRRENRMLRNLKAARDGYGRFKGKEVGHYFLDTRLANLLGVTWQDIEDDKKPGVYSEEKQIWMGVPPYTRDMSAAETLWRPGAMRRAVTTPVDCCLAAVCELWGFNEDELSPMDHW